MGVRHVDLDRPTETDWAAFRAEMPAATRWAYFDHAAVAPLSGPARQAINTWADQAARDGDVPWMSWAKQAEGCRAAAAAMLGAHRDEIALIRNTTEGINFVAEGFPWQPGDNVVLPADEFPTNQYPWLHLESRGVEVRRIAGDGSRLDLDRIDRACDQRTRVVALSWVGYASGWRTDLADATDMAHRHGALLLVDAIQGLGVFPLDVRQTPVDFVAADGHKWMLSPEGAGLFYCRPEHLEKLRPIGVGWNSVRTAGDFQHIELDFRPTAERYEGGSQNMVGMIGLKASLELLARFGQAAIGQRIIETTSELCGRLEALGAVIRTDRTPGHESGIVLFELPGRDPMAVRQKCLGEGVVLSCRAGKLRVSAHAYHNNNDLDRLEAALG